MISAWESLHFATLELVRSSPIKQRLICAYRRHLDGIAEDQLPVEVRETFSKLMSALRGVRPLRGEDAVAASVRKMSMQEADDCAARIIDIFAITCRVMLNSARASAAVVQLHSAEREAGGEHETGDFDVPALIASH
jgi:hypothetical protein